MKLEDQPCQWKPIPGYEGFYSVSDTGLVRSHPRSGTSLKGGFLKQHKVKGYMQVWLSKENRTKKLSVHRAVLMAFCRLPDYQEVCNHKDGNRENNQIGNLEWCTREYNEAHKKGVLGQDGKGKKNANYGYRHAKLYPSPALRNRLCELGVPRYKHNLAELGEMLPSGICTFRTFDGFWWCVRKHDGKSPIGSEMTEADARALMLCYLIEKGIVKP